MSETASTDGAVGSGEQRMTGLLAPLRQRTFALYFTGQFISQIGDGIYLVALPFIVLGARLGPESLGLIVSCYGFARLAAYPFGGTLSDKWGSVRVMFTADLLRVVVVLGFALLVLSVSLTLQVLIPVVVALGILEGCFMPASFAVLPQIVPASSLAASNSLTATMQSTAMIAGPAVAGPLMASFGGVLSLLIDGITFLVSTLTLAGVRYGRRSPGQIAANHQPASAEHGSWDWASVLRYLRGSPLIKMSLLITLILNLTYAGMTEVALPTFSRSDLHRGVGGFSAIMVGFGIGSLVGGLCGMFLLRVRRRGMVALLLGIAQGAAVLCIPLGTSLVVATGAMFAAGVLQASLNVFYLTILQQRIPTQALARIMSLLIMCGGIAFPVATGVAGVIVHAVGPPSVMIASGACICAGFSIGFLSRQYRTI